MSRSFDEIVIGAGVLGLAHAYHLAKAGKRVAVLERSPRAVGASVRNFGMLWPIGQPAGTLYRLARRSAAIWTAILTDAGLWHEPVGSLHLAYASDEAQVLREFAASTDLDCALIDADDAVRRGSGIVREGLKCALWSPTEICVDPRAVIAGMPEYLRRKFDVTFAFGCTAVGVADGTVVSSDGEWTAEHVTICAGHDLRTLFPDALSASGVAPCKLQMLRTAPQPGGWRLGPMLAAGLTLRHYKSFADCPTLPELKRRVAAETPAFDRYGIHVMASQNGDGEVVIGDSHEYGPDADAPFDKSEIDDLILAYLATFVTLPDPRIAARWHGVYGKHPTEPFVVLHPASRVSAVFGTGGAGMTLSFGLAENVTGERL